jgi:hypothetical protein
MTAAFNRRMRKTARTVVWEGRRAQSRRLDPILLGEFGHGDVSMFLLWISGCGEGRFARSRTRIGVNLISWAVWRLLWFLRG